MVLRETRAERRILKSMKAAMKKLVNMTSRRWSELHSARAGLKASKGLTRALFRAASGAAMLTANREMTRRVKVSAKAEANWVKNTAQKSKRKGFGKRK